MEEYNDMLFSQEVLAGMETPNLFNQPNEPVTVMGMTFSNDNERREYFIKELEKKLPELRKLEGFPIASDEEILALSDPPYYTACPNPWLHIQSQDTAQAQVAYSSDLKAEEKNAVYSYHPYHTKVPPVIIRTLLEHYTSEGNTVLDVFCGSGMTGVAARSINRNSILCDLSPVATYISYVCNHKFGLTACNVLAKIISESEKKYGFLYKTKNGGQDISVNYFVWCDVFTCPECGHEFPIFPYGVKHHGNKVETLKQFKCPNCDLDLNVRKIQRVLTTEGKKKKLVWVNAGTGKNRINREASEKDVEVFEKAKELLSESHLFYPKDIVDPNRYSAKLAQLGNKRIDNISKFLSERNLLIFADLMERINAIEYQPVRVACKSMLTSIFTVVSERQGYFGGGGGMSGNLYMPIVRMEKNIYDTLRRKITKFKEAESLKGSFGGQTYITTQSSTNLSNIPDNSVDYVYTDPPFGANIMYSEMNLLLEGWLSVKTNNNEEAIIDETTNKSEFDYSDLMTRCFTECYRILKPSHWMSVEFHNTKASIWNILQSSITKAGFIITDVVKLDKGSTTILADIREGAAVQDLIISCFKPSSSLEEKLQSSAPALNVWDYVDEYMFHQRVINTVGNQATGVEERTSKILFDRVVSYYIQHGYDVPIDSGDFLRGMRERYVEKDGMFFTAEQLVEYEKEKAKAIEFVPMGLIVSNEAEGIEWLRNRLRIKQASYQELHPDWIQAINAVRRNDVLPELKDLLEENFIEDSDGTWRLPNIQDDIDLEKMRTKNLMKEFKAYVEVASTPRGRINRARREALRCGFKDAYLAKDFQVIVRVAERIPQDLLESDEILLQFYEIAKERM
jgi:DNA modification methylase